MSPRSVHLLGPRALFRRLVLLIAAAASLLAATGSGAAQTVEAGPVVVVEVKGPLDQRSIDYLEDAIATPDAQLIVLQVNSPGMSSGDPARLFAALENPAVPVAAWIGPDPAVAFGGAGLMVAGLELSGAAPGVEFGHLSPVVQRSSVGFALELPEAVDSLRNSSVEIDEASNLLPVIQPTIGQFIAALDGTTVTGSFGTTVLETAREDTLEDGSTVIVPSTMVEFVKPDLFTRFLRLASRPEATFFYLVVGIGAAAFEFYAAGVGITAAVAALSLLLAGYGLATLPISWPALAAVLAGMLLNTADFQRSQIGLRSIVGTIMLIVGGFALTTAAPQYAPRWWAVLATIAGMGLFYGFGLTTVVRSRFSTRTIGRDYLVGQSGVAETGFDPEGIVVVDGARWRARSHRAAGISAGDAIAVREVNGIVLEIEPLGAATTDTESVRE